ncbi:hypothetical protein [Vibrio parahaemolyticus]|uniref:hypothetical protein n=1 Tax=Vibrio parahaemolyticus TaxID=670 RepID=UPI00111EE5F5|nr:hypothetical protein [Vibrio parahaemolyticus]
MKSKILIYTMIISKKEIYSALFCFMLIFSWILSNLGVHFYVVLNMIIALAYLSGYTKGVIGRETLIFLMSFLFIMFGLYKVPKDIFDQTAYIASILYCFSGIFAIRVYLSFSDKDRERALTYILYLFVLVMLLQQLTFIATGVYLDFHSLVTFFKYESRFGNNFTFLGPLIRPTLFFQEPSNCAIVIYVLSFLAYLNGNKKLCTRFLILSVFTFSFVAVFMAICLLAHLLISRIKYVKNVYYLLFILIPFVIPVLIGLFENINFGYNAIGYRLVIFKALTEATIFEKLFGFGLFFIQEPITLYGMKLNSSHFKDTGFLINILASSGAVGLTFLLGWLKKISINNVIFVFVLAILMTKIDFNTPALWIVLYGLYFYSKPISNRISLNY